MKRYGSIIGLRPDKIEEYRRPLFQSQHMNLHVTALTALRALTGPGLTWATVTLGTIQLPAGETAFELRCAPTGWKPLSIRHVWLTPATP